MVVSIDSSMREHGALIGYMIIRGVNVRPSSPILLNEITRRIEAFREKYSDLDDLRKDPVIKAYRKFLWRLNIDPTKTRPSSEALARRVLRGQPLPRINNVVDAGNTSSLVKLIPIGLYDLDRLKPPLVLTLCRKECVFEPIGGGKRRLRQGTPILVDDTGYVVHVYPHRDSLKTAITGGSRNILAVSAGVPGVPEEKLVESLEELVRLLQIDGQGIDYTRVEIIH